MSIALIAALVAFGVITGVLSGLLGVGGGIFMVPFLVFVADSTQHEAQATSLAVVLPTALVATWTLRSKGVGELPTALKIGASGAVGSVGGAALALGLPGATLRLVFAAFLGAVGLRLVRDGTRRPRQSTSR